MQKLVWRVMLIAYFGDEAAATEDEVARIERDDFAVPETLGLSLAEEKRLTAAIQTAMVRAQAATMGERFRCCAHCGSTLSSKGYRSVTFRSLFGDVPLRVRRFASCQCREIADKPISFSALTLEGGMAPELAYVTAKFAALAPFAKVADLLAELLPVGGAINAGTVRNRTRRVGERIAGLRPEGAADLDVDAVTPAVVIGLDGGYPYRYWRDFHFFGTQSLDVADHFTFAGRWREDVEAQHSERGHICVASALFGVQGEGVRADREMVPDYRHSGSGVGRLLDSPCAAE